MGSFWKSFRGGRGAASSLGARGKASRTSRPAAAGRSREADRYRKAATDALTLVDWCIEYLANNGEPHIARQLARNRNHVRGRLSS